MNKTQHIAIMIGGIFNLIFGLFHIFLCYQIYQFYKTQPVYPLLQMFAIGGMLMVFFLAYTSLACYAELKTTMLGRWVVLLNILIYFTRTLGEFILFPKPHIIIISLCSLVSLIYLYILFSSRVNIQTNDIQK
jgi:hypothetical protein